MPSNNSINLPCPEQLPDGDDKDDAEAEEPTFDDMVEAAIDYEVQQRLWVRTIIPLLELRSHETDPSGRVQLAFDLMHIAACERVARLMRADLPADRA